jgi:hypothetical protein
MEADQTLVHLNVSKSMLIQCCYGFGNLLDARTKRADLAHLVLLERRFRSCHSFPWSRDIQEH